MRQACSFRPDPITSRSLREPIRLSFRPLWTMCLRWPQGRPCDMPTFSFISVWNFEGDLLEPVWKALSAIEDWPSWWTGVEQVEVLDRGGPDRVGFRSRQVWKSKLPYKLRFQGRIDRVEPMRRIEISSEGELRGRGLMRFASSGTSTVFQYDWNVATTKAWMNLVAP